MSESELDLSPGNRFPDLDLPDHTGRPRTLSKVSGGDPIALFTSRGWWCPKEQRYMRELCRLQDEFEVAYARIVVVSVDVSEVQSAFRAGLGARFTFLSDSERSWLKRLPRPREPTRSTILTGRPPSPSFPTSPSTLRSTATGTWAERRWRRFARRCGRSSREIREDWEVPEHVSPAQPFAYVRFDGERLSDDPSAPGRRLRIHARCVSGEASGGRLRAHLRSPRIATPPCVTTSRRSSRRGGTRSPGGFRCSVPTSSASRRSRSMPAAAPAPSPWPSDPGPFDQDPFARLFPGTTVRADFFSRVPPPPGPVIERYSGAPWPAGRFAC